jgi:CheY-like chemotaxis protein
MDQETKQRMFEPFFSTKGAGRGTGLGLAVVYGIVQSDDGFVEVESEIGKGTSFHLYFPASEFIKRSPRGKKGEEVEVPGGTESILLVEDEENLLELLKTVLESKGYHVLTAKDGVEAIQKYMQSKEKIDLVLTDIGLPKLDGAMVFWTLREINPNLNVILASGYLEPQLKSELFKAGAKEFVQKPYETNVILRKIREVLDRTF